MKSVAGLLRASVALLKEKGWVQNSYHDEATDRYCAVGALEQVMVDEFGSDWGYNGEAEANYWKARRSLDDAAKVKSDFTRSDVISFNDAPGTTFGKVREVFQAAIQAAKQA